jgi:2-C-methyl-D-erythritol 4-phosphate cytidylyltransferase
MTRDAQDEDGRICAVPVKPTIKEVDPRTYIVRRTLDRSCLWDIQTPQIFKRKILEEAYASDDVMATDDAALVERLGKRVRIFPGLERNIKVTTSQDLFLAEKMLEL